ncbi:MAG: hypothetical protein PHW82_08435 [Bacteroidales bacterium]|nr:hypothetical protein [Bacteroidales bacterium]
MDNRDRFAMIDTLTVENGTTLTTPVETLRYQYNNHLGTACLELDDAAAIISYEEYHPFGTTSYRSGRNEVDVSLKRYKYVGKERDEETGLYYYGARYYAAWLCRFVSVDPLNEKYPELSSYQYASNRPITYIDLDGLEAMKPTEIMKKAKEQSKAKKSENKSHSSGIDDSGYFVNGKYREAYLLFASTTKGKNLLQQFSNGNDSSLSYLKGQEQGEFSDNLLTLRPIVKPIYDKSQYFPDRKMIGGDPGVGYSSGKAYFKLFINNKSEYIHNLTPESLESWDLTVEFIIATNITSAGAVQNSITLGHEAFLHAERDMREMFKLIDDIKSGKYNDIDGNYNYNLIFDKILEIDSMGGDFGNNDHIQIVKGGPRWDSFNEYLNQLIQNENSDSLNIESQVRNYIIEKKSQYGN